MYTIFKNDCVFYLTDKFNYSTENGFFNWNDFDISANIRQCESGKKNTFYLYHSDIEFLWKDFQKHFKKIEAAGGVVFNSEKEILFIFRDNTWDLPKGKIEKNETKEQAALREVMEECGIQNNLELGNYLGKTYHIYEFKGKEILKISHWFIMYSNEKYLKPQIEEGITKVLWMSRKDIQKALKNTYGNIALLINGITLK